MPETHQDESGYELTRKAVDYLYLQVAGHLARRIAAGKLVVHQFLPAEALLARRYGVSLGTARRATEVLRRHGLVVTLRCKGSFVAREASEDDVLRIVEAQSPSP